jgi:hypothetical protein
VKAEGVTQRICKSVPGENTGTKYVHLEGEVKMDATAAVEYFHGKFGRDLRERVPALEWVGRIKGLGFEYIWASQNISVGREEAEQRLRVVQ